jgi:hypothetical protein
MKDITFIHCVEFQDCFLFDGHFSPFEEVDDFRTYYPRVLLGEIGGLFNLTCKQRRSANIYDDEIKDECIDIFVYLLLFGRMLEIHDHRTPFGQIREKWNGSSGGETTNVVGDDDFYNECRRLMKRVDRLLDPGAEFLYNDGYFYEVFLSIQEISRYQTGLNWQQAVNDFHRQVIITHTDPKNIAADGLYKGVFRIDYGKLLKFIDTIAIKIPKKRIEFLKRMELIGTQAEALEDHNSSVLRSSAVFI